MEPASVTSNNQIVLSLDSFARRVSLPLSLSSLPPSLPPLFVTVKRTITQVIYAIGQRPAKREETVVPFPFRSGTKIIRFAPPCKLESYRKSLEGEGRRGKVEPREGEPLVIWLDFISH